MRWDIEYYITDSGDIPVRDFLMTMNSKMRAKAYSEIELLQRHGPNLREPYVKPIKGDEYRGLYELRVKFASDITRIFYFSFNKETYVLLHGFAKKSDKTPKRELDRAKRYRKDYEMRCGQ
jgi:phage-related protein